MHHPSNRKKDLKTDCNSTARQNKRRSRDSWQTPVIAVTEAEKHSRLVTASPLATSYNARSLSSSVFPRFWAQSQLLDPYSSFSYSQAGCQHARGPVGRYLPQRLFHSGAFINCLRSHQRGGGKSDVSPLFTLYLICWGGS